MLLRMARRREDNIFDACSRCEKEVVRMISAGTDPRQVRNHNFLGETLLHTACWYVMHVNPPSLQDVNSLC